MNESPYAPPAASVPDIAGLDRSKRFFGRAAWVCGFGVVIPPMVGLAGTVRGMVGAFGELDRNGSADPSVLAGHISVALLTTLWGLVISTVSFVLFAVFLTLFLMRRRTLREISSGGSGGRPS